MTLKDTYNKIAEDWSRDHSGDTWWIEGADKFSSFLKPGDSILDAGCGVGLNSEYLIKKGFNVLGIDFSEKMLEIAKGKVPDGEFRVMDIRDLSELEITFDG